MTSPDPVGPPPEDPETWDNCAIDKGRAPNGVSAPGGPGRSAKESDVNPIVTPAAPDVQSPPVTEIDRAGRLDGCPECVTNTEAPSSTYSTPDGFLANYVCLSCGHAWTTSWRD